MIRALLVVYMLLCGSLPFFYQLGPKYFYLGNTEYDLWYFIRDILAFGGVPFAASLAFEANEGLRKRLAKAIFIQSGLQLIMLFYSNCEYDPVGNLINCAVVLLTILYIYKKNKP